MAQLTEEQIVYLQETVIPAFENGKRLEDLPEATGQNPFNLTTEVLENGESKKAALAVMMPYVESQCAYGVEFDYEVITNACTRIGNLALHRDLPIQSRMRGCILDDDGNVVEYLNPADWRGQVRDGSRGQVMVEMPAFYWRFITDGTKCRVMISEYPLPGYSFCKREYVSAYEATVERGVNKLSSVVNMTEAFRGGNNQSAWDDTYRSVLGRPATAISRTNFRNYARKRKEGSTEWNCMTYEMQKRLYWLFVVEYATLNSQAAYNAAKTAEGYAQGGLGAGVTNLNGDKWNAFNGYYPFVPCGYTDELGNGTGQVAFTMPEEYSESILTVQVPRYRGVENPFGHIWQWTDGINVKISASEENGGTGISMVFICNDPDKFKDNGYDGYSHVGNEARDNGYVKKFIFGEGGEIMPETVGGSTSQGPGDYHYTNIPSAGEALRGVVFGGAAADGADAGFASADSADAPSYTGASIGSRLCFIPARAA